MYEGGLTEEELRGVDPIKLFQFLLGDIEGEIGQKIAKAVDSFLVKAIMRKRRQFCERAGII